MTYSDYQEIYNRFQELQEQINHLDERISKNLFLPVTNFALCLVTIVLILSFFVVFGIFMFKTRDKTDL